MLKKRCQNLERHKLPVITEQKTKLKNKYPKKSSKKLRKRASKRQTEVPEKKL